jgi:hypothetical protein
MGRRGRELIDRQYDINYMVRQQEELYQELWTRLAGQDKRD